MYVVMQASVGDRNADCVECAKPIKELNNSAIVHHEPVCKAGPRCQINKCRVDTDNRQRPRPEELQSSPLSGKSTVDISSGAHRTEPREKIEIEQVTPGREMVELT